MQDKDNLWKERIASEPIRAVAEQAFSRVAGTPLSEGNQVRLLRDAAENYPAWLDAIRLATRYIHFESYIIHEDDSGREFADALLAKAREGVDVRLIYDWMGGFGKTSRHFWNRLRSGGIEVRCYNPPRFDSPLGWLSRDHRKTIVVDGQIGYVTGLCVGTMWVGDPKRNLAPWRDTGVEVRGSAVADIAKAFEQVWATIGEPIPDDQLGSRTPPAPAGDMSLRVVASMPATAALFRLDLMIAALARERLWLTDAYYAGTTPYVQALRSAAKDGVDVRLLVPGGTDIPLLRPLSRAGYRPLLETGVRVFEWNGPMMHAKTAVADGRWARVGSSNLNIASWQGNYEMDVVVEDPRFGREMEEMYLHDLTNTTEVLLKRARPTRARAKLDRPQPVASSGTGSVGRAAAGAVRLSNAIGAAFTDSRVLEPVEARIMITVGGLLLTLAVLFVFLPKLLLYPVVALSTWLAVVFLYKGWKLMVDRKR
jgi:cardiolipin synthase A/B